MKISKTKKLEIACVCYANVATEFAIFNNPKYCGVNFSWENFSSDCVSKVDMWMAIHLVYSSSDYKNKANLDSLARQYTKQFADSLVDHLTATV